MHYICEQFITNICSVSSMILRLNFAGLQTFVIFNWQKLHGCAWDTNIIRLRAFSVSLYLQHVSCGDESLRGGITRSPDVKGEHKNALRLTSSIHPCFAMLSAVCPLINSKFRPYLSFFDGQDISRYLWNTKIHYHTHNSHIIEPRPGQFNVLHIVTSCIFIVPTFKLCNYLKRLNYLGDLGLHVCRPEFLCVYSSFPCYMSFHLMDLDLITLVTFSEE